MKHTVSVLNDRLNRIMTAVTSTGGRTNSQGCFRLRAQGIVQPSETNTTRASRHLQVTVHMRIGSLRGTGQGRAYTHN